MHLFSDSEEEFHSQLDKLLNDVHVKIYPTKCGVFGPPGTGKSNFKALISGKKRPAGRQSTAIATDAEQLTPLNIDEELVEMHRTRDGANVRWYVTDNKKLALLVAKTLFDRKKPITLSVDEMRRMSKTREKILDNMTELICRKLQRNPKGLKGMRLIYLVDTGGQPQFQEVMPMFVRSSSVHFLVHKLNESLNDCPRFNYEINGIKYTVPEKLLVSNKAYLEQSLRTISSCIFSHRIRRRVSTRVPRPHFAVIGMFKDLCVHIDENHKEVYECIKPFVESKKCVPFTPSRRIDKPVFAINGSEEGWSTNGAVINELHTYIETFTDELGVDIPICWFLFLNILKEKSAEKMFLSLQDCYQLAKDEDLMMDKEDVDEALELFDELNLVLHFVKHLPEIVFISPSFLLNKVSEIIVQSFDCASPTTCTGITPDERVQFRTTGIIDKSTLQKIKSFQNGFDSSFTLNVLFELLMKLCIVAEIGPNRYFMPCVLPLEQERVNSDFLKRTKRQMDMNKVEPLVISFPDDYSPRGLFCASVSFLAKLPNWKIESDSCPLERKRNLVEFELSECKQLADETPIGNVIIVDRIPYFEVYSTCPLKHLCNIRRTINKALWNASDNCLGYSPQNIGLSFGFLCQIECGKSKPHGTRTELQDKDVPQWATKCIKDSKRHARKLTETQQPWFSLSTSESEHNNPLLHYRLFVIENNNSKVF